MISRASWRARNTDPPRDRLSKRTLVIHHSAAFGLPIDRKAEQRATMRAWQVFHMDVNGWTDIGYLAGVFQPNGRLRRSRAYVGRHDNQGAKFIGNFNPAAQLNHNAGTIAVVVAGNFESERLRRGTRSKLVRIARECKRRFGVTHLAGHRDFARKFNDTTATACPGDNLYAALDGIAREVGLRRGIG
jgi:hypothetical protein